MSEKFNNNIISMFDIENDQKPFINNKIDVVELSYLGANSLTWEELFSGYDNLYAITYSSGINFVYRLLTMFKNADIIFGCEKVMSYSFQEILVYQNKVIERLRTNLSKSKIDILERIDNGTLNMSVACKQISHEKIYLLESDNGKKRVIMGSANMSYNAFSGLQRENICYIDGDEAFDWYMNVFLSLKQDSTNNITRKAIELSDLENNIDELPFSQAIKTDKLISIETTKENDEEIKFILDIEKASEKIKPLIPSTLNKSKSGKTIISYDDLIRLKRHITEERVKENELKSVFPQLKIDVDNSTVSLNDNFMELKPSKEDVLKDVELFIQYMDGYKQFHGDSKEMQYRYYEFANWFFCSPFMAIMRDTAIRYDQQKLPYPIFGLLYGQSKAGKTSFLETLLKMMIGQKPKMSAPDFTRSSIDTIRYNVQGAPIIVDDITNTRFNQHAVETIKNDEFGYADHLINYPVVVISANEDVKAVSQEVTRRTVICRVEAGLTNTEVMKSNIVRKVQSKIGTAFYRMYLNRMIPIVSDLINSMKDDESDCAPDILKKSSEVLKDIINESCDSVPDYVRLLSLNDYFGEEVTGKSAKKTIQRAWKTNKKDFIINKKSNELKYNAATPIEAERLLKELPETLEGRKSREWIVMNLSAAQQFFEINFKYSFFKK